MSQVLQWFGGDWVVAGLLALWSVVGLTVVLERIYVLWDAAGRSSRFAERVFDRLRKGEVEAAAMLCEASSVPLATVFFRAFDVWRKNPAKAVASVAVQRQAVIMQLKQRLWLLATIGSTAPFVGLFGTVVGIIRAFFSMSAQGMGGFKVVSAGLSQALVATAGGLIIAVYTLIAYNYFVARLNALSQLYRVLCDELFVMLDRRSNGDQV
jgi:biopolymer transport protein ExbB